MPSFAVPSVAVPSFAVPSLAVPSFAVPSFAVTLVRSDPSARASGTVLRISTLIRRHVDIDADLWMSVIEATGQPL